MMGKPSGQKELFNYSVDLDPRIRADHPLRRIRAQIDFSFVREAVRNGYGYNGHVSEDPAVIMKMTFLFFLDDMGRRRELMQIIAERLDYPWFPGYGLDDEIPDHSVLSKARKRWGVAVFESLFTGIVGQCVAAGLVDGKKIHVDASLIEANTSKDSVVKGSAEWIAALKPAYPATESKQEDTATPDSRVAVNDTMLTTADPVARLTRMGSGQSRPRYHHHRVVDDAQGVITAIETTSGSIAENKRLMGLVEQNAANAGSAADTVVADRKDGTVENYVACQRQGITTHMGDVLAKQTNNPRRRGIFPGGAFQYDEQQELLDRARTQTRSPAAYRNRRRRKHLAEGRFADAANNHHFKRSHWRRRWRQQIQDLLIAAIQNVKILLKHAERRGAVARRQIQTGCRTASVQITTHAIRNTRIFTSVWSDTWLNLAPRWI